MSAYLLFGKSAWAGRLPSFVCGIASLAFVYQAGRDFLSRRIGVASLAPIPVTPDPSDRFRYDENPATLSVFENWTVS